VGKSTCAAGLALAFARRGERILLVELGARSVVGELMGAGKVTHRPTTPLLAAPTLSAAHLDAHECLKEYLTEQLKISRLVSLATDNRLLARLWQAAPSVNEMSLLNAIFEHERARDGAGRKQFDRIVVDMPATGHALSTLGVPRGAMGMIRVGSLAERARELDRLLHDRTRTAVCIVTLAEELPVNESIDLAARLESEHGIPVAQVIINRVLPELLDVAEQQLLARLSGTDAVGAGQALIDAVLPDQARRRLQTDRIAILESRITAAFIEVPELARQGLARVEAVAERLGDLLP